MKLIVKAARQQRCSASAQNGKFGSVFRRVDITLALGHLITGILTAEKVNRLQSVLFTLAINLRRQRRD